MTERLAAVEPSEEETALQAPSAFAGDLLPSSPPN